jgi:hypothetical protein
MGVVWEGRDERLERRVALKQLYRGDTYAEDRATAGQPCVLDSSAHVLEGAASTPRPTRSARACSMSATTRCKPFIVPGAISS